MSLRPSGMLCILLLSPVAAFAQPVINTIAGSGRTLRGAGGPATAVALANPYYLALDSNNNLYVSDRIYNTVAKITPGGILTVFAGNGVFGFSGDNGPAPQASFRYALGLTFDSSGNTYVADAENGRIRKIAPAGTISTFAGGNCCASDMGDGGLATQAWLSITSSSTIGPKGELYITDTDHQVIRKVDAAGIITTVAGKVTADTLNGIGAFAGDNGPATAASLNLPYRVVFDHAGNMFICDGRNSRIRKVTPGGIITTFVGGGTIMAVDGASATAIGLSGPSDLAIDSSDNLYIPDSSHQMVLKVSPAGIVTVLAGTGVSGFSGDGGPAKLAQLSVPSSVVADSQGYVYIADRENARVRRIDLAGNISTWAGNGATNFSGDGGPALQSLLDRPQGIAMDPAGNLLIADVYNNRIRRIDTAGIITTIAGTGAAGYSGDHGQATLAILNAPRGIAVDTHANVYIADTLNAVIRKIDSSGVITTIAGGAQTNPFCGGPVAPTSAKLVYPVGLAVDASGVLFIADSGAHCVSTIGADGLLRHIAGQGTQGYSGDGGLAVNTLLSSPQSIQPDGKGGLYIADSLNERIRYIGTDGRISTITGTGVSGFSQPNGPLAINANIEEPDSLALGRDGSLYIGGGGSGPIVRVTPDGLLNAEIVDFNAGFIGDGGPAIKAQTNHLWGLTTDANGDLFVADQQNDRIRKVTLRTLALSTQTLNTGAAPGSSPANTPVTISNTGEGILNWSASVTTNQGTGWLKISASSGTAPSTITVTADPGSLAAGTYTGTVTFSSPAATGSPSPLAVNFTINSYNISGAITSAGNPVSGVKLALNPGGSASTNSSGSYSFNAVAAGGPYTITPSLAGYIFVPSSRTIANLSANQVANFAAISISPIVVNTGAVGWHIYTAGAGSVSITTDRPRSGNGSLRLSKVGPSDAAQYSYVSATPLGTWSTLTAFSADFYIESGAPQPPSLVLQVYAQNDSRSFSAVACPIGCSSNTPAGSWQSLNALNETFHLFGANGNPPPASLAAIPPDAPVYGVQIWSPYANAEPWTGYADNVTLAFNGAGQTFNFEVPVTLAVSPVKLNFGSQGSAITSPQVMTLSFPGGSPVSWTAASNQSNITVNPNHGIGSATLTVSAQPGPSGPISITAPGTTNAPLQIPVNVATASSGAPFGSFDTPPDGSAGISGAVAVTGWALDNVEVAKVDIWREKVGSEPVAPNGLVYIGDAVFVAGARPDVQNANPNVPLNYRAGWGYLMLTTGLPPNGNGTYKLHAIAHNKAGTAADLGTKAITVDNAHSTKPFGTIDTPDQGGTVSGTQFINFGWALAQNPNCVPTDGSTMTVTVDGVTLGHPTYNQNRADLAAAFPGRCNSAGAAGYFFIDTTKLTNGVHTIGWLAYDDHGNGDGLGSRFFNVFNTNGGSAIPEEPVQAAAQDLPDHLDLEELDRIELPVGAVSGYLDANNQRMSLPIGSTLKGGVFYGQLGPGFHGTYPLVFQRPDGSSVRVRVTVHPKTYRQSSVR